MGWLNREGNPDPANVDSPDGVAKPAEKTPAELIAEALSPFAAQFTSLNQQMAELKENTKPKAPEPREPQAIASVYEDEDAAFAQRMTPLMIKQFEIESRMVLGEVKREYEKMGFGDMWEKFEDEINTTLNNSPLVDANGKPLRGSPEYIRNVVDMVLGRAARTKGLRFNGKDQSFFLESAGGEANSGGGPANDGLTDSQRKVFQRMGISPTDGKKTMDKMQFLS